MDYDITKQHFIPGEIAYWGNEPVKIYSVDRMGPTPDHAVYYWVKPVLFSSKLSVFIYSLFYYPGWLIGKVFGHKIGMSIYTNRLANKFFWFPGHALMPGVELFKTEREYAEY